VIRVVELTEPNRDGADLDHATLGELVFG